MNRESAGAQGEGRRSTEFTYYARAQIHKHGSFGNMQDFSVAGTPQGAAGRETGNVGGDQNLLGHGNFIL